MRAGPKFTAGDSVKTTVQTRSHSKPSEPTKPGGRSASGMPGYITTTTDRSSANMRRGQGSVAAINGPKSIPSRKGPSRTNIQSAAQAQGSMDKSYRATSTGPAGRVRPTTRPMAPKARNLTSNTDGARKLSGGLGMRNPRAPRVHGTTSRSTLGGKGTMESLVGKARVGNITGRKKSMFY